ncbi:MAG: hypothetical protein COV74_08890 [Candidatus Omnitrophica bacterium CG11_big_fil_rev_8_21_14_0_20_45_26]|uniref:CNNM transmembrane domain-containing protein n=1 Tax=Candidatus Abzuiibacterium crystallinum TaxID=1974748 RepID=A0A2H0LLZ9_9BACT|nr:MAG: hypothetical protein COV74_08890 [Candidatus Omnitrophica bacterium CG11_big_fil_rev_8_21_14_0_20_45_26]PIW64432.1 MAG: hypothetical protein COW12_06235 [Candidatus Omnitrophica bacterium CG12_big_fil_rev_8_21_14_0_65_45_16]
MTSLILLMGFTFLLMAFFAGSEMAFLSCNKLKAKHLASTGKSAATIVQDFQREPKWILTTILIGTNFAHVSLTAIFAYMMERSFHIHEEWVITIMLAPFVIIFAETVPKDWFRQKADTFVYVIAPIFRFFEKVFSPVLKIVVAVSDFFISLMPPPVKRSLFVTKDEFKYMVNESASEGVLQEHEQKMIHTILDLGSVTVGEVMTPIKRAPKVELSGKVKDVKETARQHKKPMVLVYEEMPTLVVGIIHIFDVLFENDLNKRLASFLRAPLFIPQEQSVEATIFLLQSKHSSCALVTNASREVIGMVELENLIRF